MAGNPPIPGIHGRHPPHSVGRPGSFWLTTPTLPPGREGRLGVDVGEFVLQAVREKIARARPFHEVCAPFAQAVNASGMSAEQLTGFFEEVREEVWQDSSVAIRISSI